MAITPVTSSVDVYWNDSKPTLDANFAELNKQYTMTTAATPATGTCAVQFQFKDPTTGANLTYPFAGICYSSTSTGLAIQAITSAAVLTNGALLALSATSLWHFVTDATGRVGMTLTGSAGAKYVTFVLPNGRLLISTVCTIN